MSKWLRLFSQEDKRGFSLVELIVALGVFGFLLSSAGILMVKLPFSFLSVAQQRNAVAAESYLTFFLEKNLTQAASVTFSDNGNIGVSATAYFLRAVVPVNGGSDNIFWLKYDCFDPACILTEDLYSISTSQTDAAIINGTDVTNVTNWQRISTGEFKLPNPPANPFSNPDSNIVRVQFTLANPQGSMQTYDQTFHLEGGP